MFVAYSHDAIKDSPSPAAAEGLTTGEEAELSRYYGTERYAPSALVLTVTVNLGLRATWRVGPTNRFNAGL